MAGSLEYTKLDEKPDFFTFLFVAFVHVWFAISGTDQSWNLTILRSGALLPLKTVCQIPAHSFEFLTWVLYYLPWKSRSSKCLSYFPVGRNIHINYNLKQSSLISGKGEMVGIMKMALLYLSLGLSHVQCGSIIVSVTRNCNTAGMFIIRYNIRVKRVFFSASYDVN